MASKESEELDRKFLEWDKRLLARTRNIRLIPEVNCRKGGKTAYGEWAHVIGIFQTLIYLHLSRHSDNVILDFGCGTGLLGIACEPFVMESGKYIGLDVFEEDVAFCRGHYPPEYFEFQHLHAPNAFYTPEQGPGPKAWDIDSNSVDMVMALSVWTHLNRRDAIFNMQEVHRVLKLGGRAIITFFLLDEVYENSLPHRKAEPGKFHNTKQDRWIFDTSLDGSDAWYHPHWVDQPEAAIGITPEGLELLLETSGLALVAKYLGNWKEIPGIYFQDVLVFEKPQP